jgi:hypothetical protein
MSGKGVAGSNSWTHRRSRESSRWFVANRPQATPSGRCAWAEQAVKPKLVPRVGQETVRILLLNHDLKPWRGKNVARGGTEPSVYRKDGRRSGDL